MSHFHLSVTMVCVNCESVFAVQPTCPGCGSEVIYPVDRFLSRRAGRAHEAATVAELERLHVLRSA